LKVLVDTPIWSFAFRSKNAGFENHVENLKALIIDFLICAVAVRLSVEIYTTDKDFLNYQKHLPIKLYSIGID